MTGPFIAIDWGTTSRRIYLIEGGTVAAVERDDRGASTLTAGGYPAELAAIRARMGDLPILIAGMAGSNIGWRMVPYSSAPVGLHDLARALDWVDDRTAIVPGVSCRDGDRVDVMRGEEVQLLGAAQAGKVPADATLCQPGTHCKWVELRAGAIVRFTTAMTGELFALLSSHGLLARQLTGEVKLGPAFLAGVEEGARRDLAASLFAVRAKGLMGLLAEADASSFASAILIGADVASRIASGDTIHIVGEPHLGSLYAAAIEALGGTAHRTDSEDAFVAGICRLWELAS